MKNRIGLALGSATLLAFLGLWEGGKHKDGSSTVYADKLAGGLPTVCSGITKHITTTPIIVGERWSAEKCIEEERKAVSKVQEQLLKCFTVKPPQSVLDAATSFAWNVGASSVCKSGAMQAWQRGEWVRGCERIAFTDSGKRSWSYAGGKFVKGLANRRDAEVKLCKSGL